MERLSTRDFKLTAAANRHRGSPPDIVRRDAELKILCFMLGHDIELTTEIDEREGRGLDFGWPIA